ncbi:MAG TPA: sigma-70 family RNA polymerase sigma factor [Chitinophagaceae bacterium]
MTEKEYNACVDRYSDRVFGFVLKNIKNGEDAKDIVQTAFEKLWKCRDQVDCDKAKSFLFTVAYNQIIDESRTNKRIQFFGRLDVKLRIEPSVQNMQLRKTLMEALDRLNHTQRSLVMLKDYEGYNYAEIGKITNLDAVQVKVYLHRARLKLKEYLVSPENVM